MCSGVGTERNLVAHPSFIHYVHRVDRIKSTLLVGVGHHPDNHPASTNAIRVVIPCPERHTQCVDRINGFIHRRQDNTTERSIVVPANHHYGMAARMGFPRIIGNICIMARHPLPARNVGGLGGRTHEFEILGIRQCVNRAAKCTERQHLRPTGKMVPAKQPDINIIHRVGQQTRQQHTVGIPHRHNIGVGDGETRKAESHFILRGSTILPTHRGGKRRHTLDIHRRNRTARHYGINLQIVDKNVWHIGVLRLNRQPP